MGGADRLDDGEPEADPAVVPAPAAVGPAEPLEGVRQKRAREAGPHFEELCRAYALAVPANAFGGVPGEVGSGIVHDPVRRKGIQVDAAVLGPAVPGEPRRVLAVGEAKFGDVMGARHVQRLRRARDLLGERGYDTSETILACYSGAGFGRRPPPGTARSLSGRFL